MALETKANVTGVVEESERQLVQRACSGDTKAFGTLVEQYKRRAYYAALGLVGSPDDALDLSQEAFVRAFRARRRIDPERPFYTWFYQILRRLCFNFIRDRNSRSRKLREASAWMVEEMRSSQPDAQETLEREERRQLVQRAIETLPEHEREMLVLKEFEGLRYREIAELMDIPIGTVMSRLYSARQRLAEAMEVKA